MELFRLRPAIEPSCIAAVSPRNCFSLVLLLMLKALWTVASIFTPQLDSKSTKSSNIHRNQTSPGIPMDIILLSDQLWPQWARIGLWTVLQYQTVKMATYLTAQWALLVHCYVWWIVHCKAQGLSLIFPKVVSVVYLALSLSLSRYGGDCKHCNGGHVEVCSKVHG